MTGDNMDLMTIKLVLLALMTVVLLIAWYKSDVDYDDTKTTTRLKPGSKPWKWFKRRD